MSHDFDITYENKISVAWNNFSIDNAGFVRNQDGEDLGHIEDCLEEWERMLERGEY